MADVSQAPPTTGDDGPAVGGIVDEVDPTMIDSELQGRWFSWLAVYWNYYIPTLSVFEWLLYAFTVMLAVAIAASWLEGLLDYFWSQPAVARKATTASNGSPIKTRGLGGRTKEMQKKLTAKSTAAAEIRKQKKRAELEAHAASYGVTRGRKLGQGDPVTSRSISSSKPAKSSVPPTTATTTTTANSTLASATASVSALSSSRTFGGLSQDAVERNNPVNPRGYRAPPDPELVLRQRRQREDSAIRRAQDAEYAASLAADQARAVAAALAAQQQEEEVAAEEAAAIAAAQAAADAEAAANVEARTEEARRAALLASVGEEPEPGGGGGGRNGSVVTVLIRMPNGKKAERRFLADTATVQQLQNFAAWHGFPQSTYLLRTTYPNKVLEDGEAVLSSIGLTGKCAIHCQER